MRKKETISSEETISSIRTKEEDELSCTLTAITMAKRRGPNDPPPAYGKFARTHFKFFVCVLGVINELIFFTFFISILLGFWLVEML